MSEQTQIGKGDIEKKHQEWIEYPAKRINELIQGARRVGKNPDEVGLGYLLVTITGDDANCFYPVMLSGFSPDASRKAASSISKRIEWEIEVPQAPQVLRERLKSVKERLGKIKWDTNEGFDEGYQMWKEEVQKWLLALEKKEPTIKSAVKTYQEFAELTGKTS